jgi:hypothetical protein
MRNLGSDMITIVVASAAYAVPLPVLVVNDRDGVQHRGTLQLPRCAPAAASGRPQSSADLARLRPKRGSAIPRRVAKCGMRLAVYMPVSSSLMDSLMATVKLRNMLPGSYHIYTNAYAWRRSQMFVDPFSVDIYFGNGVNSNVDIDTVARIFPGGKWFHVWPLIALSPPLCPPF